MKYASKQLKEDKSFILKAIEIYPRALEFASDEIKNDKKFILSLVKNDGKLLKYLK